MPDLAVPNGQLFYAGAGSGTTPVLLLHAGYVDHRMWNREFDHLSQRTRVVAPDARAHGRSSTPHSPFRHCDDVAALVRHLDQGPAVLIGVSMGAAAAVDTALEHPDVVRALVISGAGTNEPEFTDPAALRLLDRAEQAIARWDAQAWLDATLEWIAGPNRALDEVHPEVVSKIQRLHEDFVRTQIKPGMVPPTHVINSWQRLREITVPVWGIGGADDFPDHLRMCERAVTSVGDGRGVITMPRAGHYPNLEQPDLWERTIDHILDELSTETGAPVVSGLGDRRSA